MDRFVIKRKIPPPMISVDDLAFDLAKRKIIREYDHNHIDEVRRIYLIRGPCQLRGHTFKQKSIGGVWRRFNPQWFDQYQSTKKAFCLFCFLFRVQVGKQGGSDTFVSMGFLAGIRLIVSVSMWEIILVFTMMLKINVKI